MHQKCTHRSKLNVRVKLLTPGGRYGPFLWDNHNGTPPAMKAYAACVKSINGDKPKVVPMPEQGARFQMAVHVEGNGGWADRLRHLLLSGMVVLKQDMGVGECTSTCVFSRSSARTSTRASRSTPRCLSASSR